MELTHSLNSRRTKEALPLCVPGRVVAEPKGHCVLFICGRRFRLAPAPKPGSHKHAGTRIRKIFFVLCWIFFSFPLNQILYMLFVFIHCPKPWDGPIGITLQVPAPLLAQVLLISPAQICKPDWQPLLQEAPSPLGNKGKPSEPLGIIAVIWILCFFTLLRTSWMHLFILKC